METVSASPDHALADFRNALHDVKEALAETRAIHDGEKTPREIADALVYTGMALNDALKVLDAAENRRTLEGEAFTAFGNQRFREGAAWCRKRHEAGDSRELLRIVS